MPSVDSNFRNSVRISRVAWLYSGVLTATTDSDGEIEFDFTSKVGKILSVQFGVAEQGTNRCVCTYDDGTITAYAVEDDTVIDSEEVEIPFTVIGTKGRITD